MAGSRWIVAWGCAGTWLSGNSGMQRVVGSGRGRVRRADFARRRVGTGSRGTDRARIVGRGDDAGARVVGRERGAFGPGSQLKMGVAQQVRRVARVGGGCGGLSGARLHGTRLYWVVGRASVCAERLGLSHGPGRVRGLGSSRRWGPLRLVAGIVGRARKDGWGAARAGQSNWRGWATNWHVVIGGGGWVSGVGSSGRGKVGSSPDEAGRAMSVALACEGMCCRVEGASLSVAGRSGCAWSATGCRQGGSWARWGNVDSQDSHSGW